MLRACHTSRKVVLKAHSGVIKSSTGSIIRFDGRHDTIILLNLLEWPLAPDLSFTSHTHQFSGIKSLGLNWLDCPGFFEWSSLISQFEDLETLYILDATTALRVREGGQFKLGLENNEKSLRGWKALEHPWSARPSQNSAVDCTRGLWVAKVTVELEVYRKAHKPGWRVPEIIPSKLWMKVKDRSGK
jgi:hypothetical protein